MSDILQQSFTNTAVQNSNFGPVLEMFCQATTQRKFVAVVSVLFYSNGLVGNF